MSSSLPVGHNITGEKLNLHNEAMIDSITRERFAHSYVSNVR